MTNKNIFTINNNILIHSFHSKFKNNYLENIVSSYNKKSVVYNDKVCR